MTNLDFTPLLSPARDSVKVRSSWTDLDIARVLERPALREIHVLRYRTAEDSVHRWVVDTSGQLDFTRGQSLVFRMVGKELVASIALPIRDRGAHSARLVMVPYQFIDAGKYQYARIAELRTGSVALNGQSYAIQVRGRSRRYPFYEAKTGTRVLMDFDRNGEFAKFIRSTVRGRPSLAEAVEPDVPFVVGGQGYELESIDSLGSEIVFRRSTRTIAVAPGYLPPTFRAADLSGRDIQLSEHRGRPVLLEFWSTECPHSESARTPLNELRGKLGERYAWIAMAVETATRDISDTLAVRPRHARVAPRDSLTWAAFNPQWATPHFVLLDADGRIALVVTGASAVPLVAAKLEELLGKQ